MFNLSPSLDLDWRERRSNPRYSKMTSLTFALVSMLYLFGDVCSMIQVKEERDISFCLNSPFSQNASVTEQCSKAFRSIIGETGRRLNFTEDEINYLWSLDREMQGMFHKQRRVRRQIGRPFLLPVRRECRLISERERMNLFYAIRFLKFNTNPNAYNTLANLHRGTTVDEHAHRGSNFLGWHRVYLVYFEIALRRIRGDVTLCFWDTTMECKLGHHLWNETAVFSANFFGNRNGMVITGPFANWPMPSGLTEFGQYLSRQVGARGMPVDSRATERIFYSPNTLTHTQMTPGGSGFETITNKMGQTRNITIEGEHNNVHIFVGRAMSRVNSATQDPVFWFHHCYVDYMWERFRQKLYAYGRDPTTDYPLIGDATLHAPDYQMIGFPEYRNIDGYSDRFTKDIYTYESPTCDACYRSLYTVCDQENECMARINIPGTEVVNGPYQPGTEPSSRAMATLEADVTGTSTQLGSTMGRSFTLTSSIE